MMDMGSFLVGLLIGSSVGLVMFALLLTARDEFK